MVNSLIKYSFLQKSLVYSPLYTEKTKPDTTNKIKLLFLTRNENTVTTIPKRKLK